MIGPPIGEAPARRGTLSPPALLAASAILILAFLDGRYVAYLNSRPAFFARIDVLFVLAGTVVATLLLAFFARRMARGASRFAVGRPGLVIGSLVAAGFAVGFATAGATNAIHREPVVLQAIAKAAGELPDLEGFAGLADTPAACRSVPDGTDVAAIDGDAIGSIDDVTLRASLSIGPDRTVVGELFADGADLPQGSGAPTWHGALTVAEMAPDGRSGRVTFTSLRLVEDALVGQRPTGTPWPATLAGSIRWTCSDWSPQPD